MTTLLLGLLATVVVCWLALIVVLLVVRPDGSTLTDALRVLPDTVGMLRRFARDPALPRPTRMIVWGLLVYLLSPIDLVPDFLPVIGYADDAIVAALALRALVRAAGPDALARHWEGSPAGLAVIHRLAGLPT